MLVARKPSCRDASAFLSTLKQIWPRCSLKSTKMSKKCLFRKKLPESMPSVNGLITLKTVATCKAHFKWDTKALKKTQHQLPIIKIATNSRIIDINLKHTICTCPSSSPVKGHQMYGVHVSLLFLYCNNIFIFLIVDSLMFMW